MSVDAPPTTAPVPAAAPAAVGTRSAADRLARRILRVETAAPRALMPMRNSIMLSAIRCLLSYVAIPILLPTAAWLAPVAAPLSLALTSLAAVLAVISLRRVWLADWSKRWAYTAFAGVVLAVLAVLITLDIRAILA